MDIDREIAQIFLDSFGDIHHYMYHVTRNILEKGSGFWYYYKGPFSLSKSVVDTALSSCSSEIERYNVLEELVRHHYCLDDISEWKYIPFTSSTKKLQQFLQKRKYDIYNSLILVTGNSSVEDTDTSGKFYCCVIPFSQLLPNISHISF